MNQSSGVQEAAQPDEPVPMSRWLRRIGRACRILKNPSGPLVNFRCNICGTHTSYPGNQMSREHWSCYYCGSNVRWRSVIHVLSMELFGSSLAISDFPTRPDLTGIGLSDWDGYATRLAKKLGYTNTFYHQEPLLDITSIDPSNLERYDFIISTDVFEHIAPPISRAFENAYRLLKPKGVLILTVPYVKGETKEHYPELYKYSIEKKNSNWVVVNETYDGRRQEFDGATFHGGPGTVLEMRLFGNEGLLRDAANAGFEDVKIYGDEYPEAGIRWIPYKAEEAQYRPFIYGLDTPPWALRKRARVRE